MSVDMESASFAHSFYQFNIPFISIRSISDIIGKNNQVEYEENLQNAANKCAKFVINLIEKI
jgi:adenosylhomocysteine nucleosidase